jgi:hypothetical protein
MFAANAYIQRRGQHRGATIRQAVHHANRRLGAGADFIAAAAADGATHVQLFLGVGDIILALLVDITTCRKCPVPGSCDDNAPDCLVRLRLLDRVVQFRAQLPIHSVELVRTIQGENCHAVCLFDQDILVGHAFLLQRTCCMIAW